MNKELIINNFSKFKKITLTSVKKFKKKYPNEVKELNDILINEPEWKTIQNVIIGIIKNKSLYHCKLCNKIIPFNNWTSEYCSTKCLNNDQNIRNKIKNTCLKKYGTENAAQSDVIKNKMKNTCLKKYGTENAAQSDVIKNKMKNTCLERYGVEYTTQSKQMKEKSKQTCLERYGIKHYINIEKQKKTILKKSFNKYLNFLDVKPLFTLDDYTGIEYYKLYKWKCKKCGNEFEDHLYSHFPTCPKCHKRKTNYSNLEKEFLEYIKEIYKGEIFENNRSIIKPYELDIVIPEKKIAFEFNGSFWHSTSSPGYFKNENKCLMKTNLCEEQGYKLIHIWEYDWINPLKQNILKEKIKALLGIEQENIYARKCVVKEINSKIKNEFLNLHHIQGEDSSKVKLGLFYNNELVAVMTFGNPRFNKKYEWELIRYATSKHIIGGAGKLLKYFERNYKPKSIITYADRSYSQGNMYNKIGFNELYKSEPNYHWVKDDKIYTRYQCQKSHLKKILGKGFNKNFSETENMLLNKFFKVYDCGNLVFEKIL